MCTLEQFKKQNNKEHNELNTTLLLMKKDITNLTILSKSTKTKVTILVTVILGLLGLNANYQRLSYEEIKYRTDVEIRAYKAINDLGDTITVHWSKSMEAYNNELKPTQARSIKNANILDKHGLK